MPEQLLYNNQNKTLFAHRINLRRKSFPAFDTLEFFVKVACAAKAKMPYRS